MRCQNEALKVTKQHFAEFDSKKYENQRFYENIDLRTKLREEFDDEDG